MKSFPSEDNIFEQATRLDRLEQAWEKVRANAGCAGSDRVTCAQFHNRSAVRLLALQRQLREGTYEPQRLRVFEIPKADGAIRRLAIPAVVDRIAQTAALPADRRRSFHGEDVDFRLL